MRTHTVTLGNEQNRIAVEHPTGRSTGIATVGQVGDLATLRTDQTYIGIGVMLIPNETEREPLAIRRPLIGEAASGAIPRRAIRHLTHLLRFQVYHHQLRAFLDESQFLTIGRELGHCALHRRTGQQHLLVDHRSIGEVGLLLTSDLRQVELPVTRALTGISQRTSIGRKAQRAFSRRRMGDLLRSGIIRGGHKHLTPHNKGHLLAILRRDSRGGSL